MDWRAREAARHVAMVRDEATIVDGVVRWNSNGQVPPSDVIDHAVAGGVPGIDVNACELARAADTRAFFAEYRRRQPAVPSAEERAEARAAFGPGVEVVDAISGRRFRT